MEHQFNGVEAGFGESAAAILNARSRLVLCKIYFLRDRKLVSASLAEAITPALPEACRINRSDSACDYDKINADCRCQAK